MTPAEWMALINMAGGTFMSLYTRARLEHGDAIPSKAEILARIEQNQKEIDAGKIKA